MRRVKYTSRVLVICQHLLAQILEVKKKERVRLRIKQIQKNPWGHGPQQLLVLAVIDAEVGLHPTVVRAEVRADLTRDQHQRPRREHMVQR